MPQVPSLNPPWGMYLYGTEMDQQYIYIYIDGSRAVYCISLSFGKLHDYLLSHVEVDNMAPTQKHKSLGTQKRRDSNPGPPGRNPPLYLRAIVLRFTSTYLTKLLDMFFTFWSPNLICLLAFLETFMRQRKIRFSLAATSTGPSPTFK